MILDNGKLWMDVPANEVRQEIEPLFDVGDITFAYGGYGDEMKPLKHQRLTERWFVAVLNSLPDPYGWMVIDSRPERPDPSSIIPV